MASLIERVRAVLQRRSKAYQTVFAGPVGELVLADLAKFCRAYTPTFHKDARIAARLDGRREVFLRIQKHLNLTDDQLWALVSNSDPDQ